MSPGRQEKNHAATCISAGRCVHKLKTPDRIFYRYIVLFKTFEFIFLFVFFCDIHIHVAVLCCVDFGSTRHEAVEEYIH
jgi:hypothetical protein